LILVLGERREQEILSVTEARFRFLAKGNGCLSWEQLESIEPKTGRAWQRWIVDAGSRHLKTVKGRAYVARAHAMWDEILGPEKKTPARSARRTNASSLRKAV
jgi:hypothetical protein